MIASEFDGQYVEYVSASGLAHTGYVVGKESDADSAFYYVHSDSVSADPELFWHFKVSREFLLSIITVEPEA